MKVSVVINCCYEGLLLRRSLESAFRSVDASGLGDACEVILIADRPTKSTSIVVDEYRDRVSATITVDLGDLGLARNVGVESARGDLVLFLDGDDLWSRNWVGAAWAENSHSPQLTILHPQYAVFFGAKTEILVHPDWRDPYFDPRGLVARNHWVSSCGARRELLVDHPYPSVDRVRLLGFEDWSWYAHMQGVGARHANVPGTAHFIRLKSVHSMNESLNGFLRAPSLEFADYIASDDFARPYNL